MHNLAIELALANPAKVKMASVITDKRGRVISYAVNSYSKTHRLQAHYGAKTGRPKAVYLHSEVASLVRCRQKPHTIYVARFTRNGDRGSSLPCPACAMAIREAQVERIVYFDEDGNEQEVWL